MAQVSRVEVENSGDGTITRIIIVDSHWEGSASAEILPAHHRHALFQWTGIDKVLEENKELKWMREGLEK